MKGDLTQLSAVQAAEAIRDGRLLSEALVTACLERIETTDGTIKAWAHLDPEIALAQAAEMDRLRKAGYATGALHGVPIGVKDIVDTRFLPTERGSPVFEGRQPDADAAVIERLREAGAVIMGKTKTTEFAFAHPTDTTNPHNPAHSPGGSSSGSAAAVAAHQVPLAIGTQTGGSMIRPASFCGIYGLKPTRGTISRRGVLQTSVHLDQLGTFGRSLEDVALLSDALGSFDPTDPESFGRPRCSALEGARADVPVEPDLAWFDMPYHDRLDPDAREGLEAVVDALGPRVQRFPVAPTLADLVNVQATIHEYEFCLHMSEVIDGHPERLSDTLRPIIARGRAISQTQYEDALAVKTSADAFFESHYRDFDAIIAPSATGEAPLLGPTTGDPVFCVIWTLAGLPAITLPLLVGERGLPIGVQLIGQVERDDRLLRTAAWVQRRLAAEAAEGED